MGLVHILNALIPGPDICKEKVTVYDKDGNEYEVDKEDLE